MLNFLSLAFRVALVFLVGWILWEMRPRGFASVPYAGSMVFGLIAFSAVMGTGKSYLFNLSMVIFVWFLLFIFLMIERSQIHGWDYNIIFYITRIENFATILGLFLLHLSAHQLSAFLTYK